MQSLINCEFASYLDSLGFTNFKRSSDRSLYNSDKWIKIRLFRTGLIKPRRDDAAKFLKVH